MSKSPLSHPPILSAILESLDDNQAIDVVTLDVKEQTTVTDYMVICSGRSSRHVKAIAENTMEKMKAQGFPSLGQSGLQTAEWILIDFGDVVLHVMQPDIRSFYYLEGLWQPTQSN